MKTTRYLIRQLSPAELGQTGTNETYVRCPNDFDYQDFFQQEGGMADTVLAINFTATDLTEGDTYNSEISFRFVYYLNSKGKEKRIPGLTELFRSWGAKVNDYIKLESITENGKTSFYATLIKGEEITIAPASIYYKETDGVKHRRSFSTNKYQEEIALLSEKYNLVLTGAPGTGKTYAAKQIAAQMITNGKSDWKGLTPEERAQVKIIQFHPSFDYTDFVEGLRPDKDGNFVRTDGVFKDFCRTAINSSAEKRKTRIIKGDTSFETIYNTIIDDVKNGEITSYQRRNGTDAKLSINPKGRLVYHMAQTKTQSEDNMKLLYEYFLENKIYDVEKKTQQEYNTLITDLTAKRSNPTKTLDYVEYAWTLQRMLNRALLANSEEGLEVNDYSQECIGLKKPYILIIDEINRGELSKIFGELFCLIEPDYRGPEERVLTQYNNMVEEDDEFKDGFYIPDNVYIIGTMNDIDRGVEAMDFAIRRRFAWKEVTAEDSAKKMGLSDDVQKVMEKLNKALLDQKLTEAHCIGGAYFLKLSEDKNYAKLWDNHLKGIITEYFRGEPDGPDKLKEIKAAYDIAVEAQTANKELSTENPTTES